MLNEVLCVNCTELSCVTYLLRHTHDRRRMGAPLCYIFYMRHNVTWWPQTSHRTDRSVKTSLLLSPPDTMTHTKTTGPAQHPLRGNQQQGTLLPTGQRPSSCNINTQFLAQRPAQLEETPRNNYTFLIEDIPLFVWTIIFINLTLDGPCIISAI